MQCRLSTLGQRDESMEDAVTACRISPGRGTDFPHEDTIIERHEHMSRRLNQFFQPLLQLPAIGMSGLGLDHEANRGHGFLQTG